MTATDDRCLERLAALLAKAESTDNDAEREAFMVKAQKLSTLYSIGLATARAHAEGKNKAAAPAMRVVAIGPQGKRGLANYARLLSWIADANNLEVSFARDYTFVELWGFTEDIELAQRLYGSLLPQMVLGSERHLATGAYKQETYRREVKRTDEWGDAELAPVTKHAARTSFQTAFATRIGDRLKQAQKETTAQVIADDGGEGCGTALALRDKDLAVKDYFEANTSYYKTLRSRGTSGWSSAAAAAGKEAADSARLNAPSPIGTNRKAIGHG